MTYSNRYTVQLTFAPRLEQYITGPSYGLSGPTKGRVHTTTPNEPFTFYGAYNASGDKTSIREARQALKDGDEVWAFDLSPGCYAPAIRVYVHGAYGETDAWEALYEAARNKPDGGLFNTLYDECDMKRVSDTDEPRYNVDACWCNDEHGTIEIGDKVYHETEGGVVGMARVVVKCHIHDGGDRAYQNRRKREERKGR